MKPATKALGWVAISLWCWFLFLWTHELGHVIGAWFTGSDVIKVVLHPLAFSRTDVQPNKNPSLVVWAGPVLGCVTAFLVSLLWCSAGKKLIPIALLGTGFAMLANGTYIGLGTIQPIADTEVMVETGSSRWVFALFGICVGVPGYILTKRALNEIKRDYTKLITARVLATLILVDCSFVLAGAILFGGP